MTAPAPIEVNFKILHPLAAEMPPAYSTTGSAGFDLRACIDQDEIEIPAGGRHAFGTGIAIDIREPGWAAFIYSRSGLGTKKGLTVSQGVGVIDPDYRGEIIVSILNTSGQRRRIQRGERIAQLVFMPFRQGKMTQVEELSDTSRGSGGFGSTGKL
ncbi:dUTP diphosphatase [Desulfovibrio ferrophilus]|uniref:dUTP diphosphatase n=1 Tax=Desulfovibrio ferrophilus TaxID=241368 RepID=A0A2Z6AXP2_9BACT|nr:deoxyuridine 5'-triphosphate nucleotidohydrolase Dut [Desulfovibrio ferrophilus]